MSGHPGLDQEAWEALVMLADALSHRLRRGVTPSQAARHAVGVALSSPPLGGGETNGETP